MSGMHFNTNQSVRLGQQMKLAPKMIQSMEILHMALACTCRNASSRSSSRTSPSRLLEPGLELEAGWRPDAVHEETRTRTSRGTPIGLAREGERELVIGADGEDGTGLRTSRWNGAGLRRATSIERGLRFSAMRTTQSSEQGERRQQDGRDGQRTVPRRKSRRSSFSKQWTFVETEDDDACEAGRRDHRIRSTMTGLLDADLEIDPQEQKVASELGTKLTQDLLQRGTLERRSGRSLNHRESRPETVRRVPAAAG